MDTKANSQDSVATPEKRHCIKKGRGKGGRTVCRKYSK